MHKDCFDPECEDCIVGNCEGCPPNKRLPSHPKDKRVYDKFKEEVEAYIIVCKESQKSKTNDKIYMLGVQRGLETALKWYTDFGTW